MVTYKLRIYNKFNQNAALASFDLSFFNSIFVTMGTFFETPQESLDNGGS